MDPILRSGRSLLAAGVCALVVLALVAATGCTSHAGSDLDALLVALTTGETSATDPWSDPRWAALRDDPEIRPMLTRSLRRHVEAVATESDGVHEAVITTGDEPGEPLEVMARVVDEGGDPVTGALLFVYHADHEGRYSPEATAPGDGERNARLFAWVTTDDRGECRIRTILPGRYGGAPPHFHFGVRREPGGERQGGGIYFEGGDWPIDAEIRSDAQSGPAILVPVTRTTSGKWTATATITP